MYIVQPGDSPNCDSIDLLLKSGCRALPAPKLLIKLATARADVDTKKRRDFIFQL